MQDNPLANFFGGGKKKPKKGGDLAKDGLDALLKDAPLPVKLIGGMLKPLAGMMGDMIAEGAEDANDLLAEAGSALRSDPQVRDLLGSDVEIGAVFSSMSSNVNGVKTMQLQAQCAGSKGSGVCAIRGGGTGSAAVESIQVQVGGRVITVGSLRGSGGGSSGGGADGVIDIEVE